MLSVFFVSLAVNGSEEHQHRVHKEPQRTPRFSKEALQTHSANMIAALDYTTRYKVKGPQIVKYFLVVTPQPPRIPLAWVPPVSQALLPARESGGQR